MIDSSDPYIYVSRFIFNSYPRSSSNKCIERRKKKKKKKKNLFNYSLKISQSANFIHKITSLRPIRCCYDVDERHRFPEIQQHEEGGEKKRGAKERRRGWAKASSPPLVYKAKREHPSASAEGFPPIECRGSIRGRDLKWN